MYLLKVEKIYYTLLFLLKRYWN